MKMRKYAYVLVVLGALCAFYGINKAWNGKGRGARGKKKTSGFHRVTSRSHSKKIQQRQFGQSRGRSSGGRQVTSVTELYDTQQRQFGQASGAAERGSDDTIAIDLVKGKIEAGDFLELNDAEWKKAQEATKRIPNYKKDFVKILEKDLKMILKEKLKEAEMYQKKIKEKLDNM